jgi:hypothetical protein
VPPSACRPPKKEEHRAYLFPDFASGLAAMHQAQRLRPADLFLRLSDDGETRFAQALERADRDWNLPDYLFDVYLSIRRFGTGAARLIAGFSGEARDVSAERGYFGDLAKRAGALALGVDEKTAKQRFLSGYRRDTLLDRGVGIDSLDLFASWAKLPGLYVAVRAALKQAMRAMPRVPARMGWCCAMSGRAVPMALFSLSPGCFPASWTMRIRPSHAIRQAALAAASIESTRNGSATCLAGIKRVVDPDAILNPENRSRNFQGQIFMDGDAAFGIDAAGIDVAQQHQHQEPELRPVMGAFGFQGHHRAAGIIGRRRAVFRSQVVRKPVKVARGHTHGQIMAGRDERELKGKFIVMFQLVIAELRAGCVICYIPHPTGVISGARQKHSSDRRRWHRGLQEPRIWCAVWPSAAINSRAILTKAGAEFVTPLSLSALTGEKIYIDLFSLTDEAEMGHIELSRSADLVVVAPATADLMAKMANGLGQRIWPSTRLAGTDKRCLDEAPAMNVRMWESAGR